MHTKIIPFGVSRICSRRGSGRARDFVLLRIDLREQLTSGLPGREVDQCYSGSDGK